MLHLLPHCQHFAGCCFNCCIFLMSPILRLCLFFISFRHLEQWEAHQEASYEWNSPCSMAECLCTVLKWCTALCTGRSSALSNITIVTESAIDCFFWNLFYRKCYWVVVTGMVCFGHRLGFRSFVNHRSKSHWGPDFQRLGYQIKTNFA